MNPEGISYWHGCATTGTGRANLLPFLVVLVVGYRHGRANLWRF